MDSNVLASVKLKLQSLVEAVSLVVLGKQQQIELGLACLLAEGHLLLEDMPGMGKTTLAESFARVFGFDFKRVQFTSDLLPGDLIGSNMFEQASGSFRFLKGPVFTQLLLADEINRASPKTQSALLEAMEERQVSVDGESMPLTRPFFVIATQNPMSQAGVYPLPESQLDRFLMRLSLGAPDPDSELSMLMGEDPRERLKHMKAVLSPEQLLKLIEYRAKIHVPKATADYMLRLAARSRESGHGLSTRALIGLKKSAQALALIQGMAAVTPEHVQRVFEAVALHRLGFIHAGRSAHEMTQQIVKDTPVMV